MPEGFAVRRFRPNSPFIQLQALMVFFGLLTAIGLAKIFTVGSLAQAPWNYGEWLINYEGGFTRRGLPGAMMLWLSGEWGFPSKILVWFLSAVSYLALLYLAFKRLRKIWPVHVLISPLLLLAPVLNDNLVRKDAFVLLIFAISLGLIPKRQETSGVRGLPLRSFLTLNTLCIVGILSHEMFFFVALPYLSLLLGHCCILRYTSYWRLHIAGVVPLLPSFLVAIVTFLPRGDPLTAERIWNSWMCEGALRSAQDSICPQSNPAEGAIASIGWTTKQGLSLPHSLLGDWAGPVPILLIWLGTVVVFAYLLTAFQIEPAHRPLTLRILISQLIFVSPLFVFGWDYGRWIYLWTISSSFIVGFVLIRLPPSSFVLTTPPLERFLGGLSKGFEPKSSWVLLAIGIPACCWNISAYSSNSPIGFLARGITHFL